MPILAAEPVCYPDDLFQDLQPIDMESRSWSVIHTRPRQEKWIARRLRSLRIAHYLPLLSRRRRLRHRTTTSYIPLFPGYLPVLSSGEERWAASRTNRVVRWLDIPNQSEFWQDLLRIMRLIESGLPITPEDRLSAGDRVVVRTGPLAGLEGTILRTEGSSRFLVQVNFIQRGASVLADDFDLAVLN